MSKIGIAHARCRIVCLETPQGDALPLLNSLNDLFYMNGVWYESLRRLCSYNTISSVKDYLDVGVIMSEGALLYCPYKEEWLSCILSISKDCDPKFIASLVDEDGKICVETLDFEAFQVVINSREPLTERLPDMCGAHRYVLVVVVREKCNLARGVRQMPISAPQATKAQIWHLTKLRDALEAHFDIFSPADEAWLSASHSLIRKLLTEPANELHQLKRHIKTLGLAGSADFVCIIFHLYCETAQRLPLQHFCTMIEAIEEGCHAIEHEHEILVLFNTRPQAPSPNNLIHRVFELIEPIRAQAGVSFQFTDLFLLRDYAKQAREALDLGMLMQKDVRIHRFEDIAPEYIVKYGSNKLPIRMLCAPGVMALQKLSDSGDVDYIATLRTYLRNSCNASETAKMLYIHRSTLLYRLERITQTIELDVNDPDDRFYVELSLALLQPMIP